MIINSDNITALKNYPDNYFDSVVTDPPYGLGKEPDANQLMKDWIEKGYHEIKGTGFMGKEWDAFVPQPLFWKEVFRVLKPGGHCLAFYGTRTYDWGVMAMRFAGFEVRDCIQWLYGSGFPKSHNIGKAIDKIEGNERVEVPSTRHSGNIENSPYHAKGIVDKVPINTKGNSEWEGWGSALKPANEPIVLARKPLEKGLSIAENVLKYGTGGINIDGCRVSGVNMTKGGCKFNSAFFKSGESNFTQDYDSSQGRFPANIILTHHPECECKGLKKVKGQIDKPTNRTKFEGTWNEGNTGLRNNTNLSKEGYADENGQETVEDWNCHPDCPIKILDEQSGVTKSQRSERGNIIDNNVYGKYKEQEDTTRGHNDSGGASRFFYVAKASKSERNKGLEGFEEKQTIGGGGGIGDYIDDVNSASGKYGSEKAPNKNFHPTVKPIKLMQYLVRLVTPPNGIVLDPFCGSGTTGIACKLEGFEFVGMEQDAEYSKIAEARIESTKKDLTLF